MSVPFFSIIIPVYNVEKYIKECIQSCLKQTFKNFEIIIVDDFGNDKSMEIIKSFRDSRIKIFYNKVNMGTLQSRIFGLYKATGRFILFLDGDDMFFLNILHSLFQILIQFPNIHILSFRSKTNKIIKSIEKMPIGQYNATDLNNYFLWGKCFNSALIKKALQAITTKEKISNGEDVYLNLIFLSMCQSYMGIKTFGYFYRIHNDSITQTSNSKKQKDLLKLIEIIDHEDIKNSALKKQALSILKSAFWIEQRYEKKYLYCCLRAFFQLPRIKTFLRLFLYIFSFRKIRI